MLVCLNGSGLCRCSDVIINRTPFIHKSPSCTINIWLSTQNAILQMHSKMPGQKCCFSEAGGFSAIFHLSKCHLGKTLLYQVGIVDHLQNYFILVTFLKLLCTSQVQCQGQVLLSTVVFLCPSFFEIFFLWLSIFLPLLSIFLHVL